MVIDSSPSIFESNQLVIEWNLNSSHRGSWTPTGVDLINNVGYNSRREHYFSWWVAHCIEVVRNYWQTDNSVIRPTLLLPSTGVWIFCVNPGFILTDVVRNVGLTCKISTAVKPHLLCCWWPCWPGGFSLQITRCRRDMKVLSSVSVPVDISGVCMSHLMQASCSGFVCRCFKCSCTTFICEL